MLILPFYVVHAACQGLIGVRQATFLTEKKKAQLKSVCNYDFKMVSKREKSKGNRYLILNPM